MDLQEGAQMMDALAAKIAGMATPPPGTIEAVLKRGHDIIVERTTEGLDMNGSAFPKYSTTRIYIGQDSPYYAIAVSAGGRTVRKSNGAAILGVVFDGGYAEFKAKLGHSNVDLFVLGDMLAAIDEVADEPDRGRLGIFNQTQNAKGAAHQNGGGVPMRQFWGLGFREGEAEELTEIVRSSYVEYLNESLFSEAT